MLFVLAHSGGAFHSVVPRRRHQRLTGTRSGLATAAFSPDSDYLILESDAEIGGYCKTIKRAGFVWDGTAMHFCDGFEISTAWTGGDLGNVEDLLGAWNTVATSSVLYRNRGVEELPGGAGQVHLHEPLAAPRRARDVRRRRVDRAGRSVDRGAGGSGRSRESATP